MISVKMNIQTSNRFIHICLHLDSECLYVEILVLAKQTSYINHILMKPVYYDRIHLYGKNFEQEKYKHMIKEFNDFSNEVGYDIMMR